MIHGTNQHGAMLVDFFDEFADESGFFGETRGVGSRV